MRSLAAAWTVRPSVLVLRAFSPVHTATSLGDVPRRASPRAVGRRHLGRVLASITHVMWPRTTLPGILAAVGISAAVLAFKYAPLDKAWGRRDQCVMGAASGQGNRAETGGGGGASGHRIQVRGKDYVSLSKFESLLSDKDRALLNSDETAPAVAGGFNTSQFFAALNSGSIGKVVLYSRALPSTQTLLFKDLESEQDGTVCVSDTQTAGRGRGGNEWSSPEGCLAFSFSTSVKEASSLPFFQYLVSMAIYEAVSEMVGGDAKGTIGLQLKWPNDVYGPNNTKIGGVLCESKVKMSIEKSSSATFLVVAGVGINLFNTRPTTCLQDMFVRSGFPEVANRLTKESFLAEFCHHFEKLLDVLDKDGFVPLRESYLSMWMHNGQVVYITDGYGDPKTATIRGIAPSGFLMAEDDQGMTLELHPDGNSFNMLEGLISRKILRPFR